MIATWKVQQDFCEVFWNIQWSRDLFRKGDKAETQELEFWLHGRQYLFEIVLPLHRIVLIRFVWATILWSIAKWFDASPDAQHSFASKTVLPRIHDSLFPLTYNPTFYMPKFSHSHWWEPTKPLRARPVLPNHQIIVVICSYLPQFEHWSIQIAACSFDSSQLI